MNLNLIARSYALFHQYATKILFTTVSSSEKYLDSASMRANIAAFRVNESTRINIEDLFAALTITWKYIPDARDIKKYAAVYYTQYGDVLDGDWLKFLFYHQEKTIARRFINASEELSSIKSVIAGYDNLYLYGTGFKAKIIYKLLGDFQIKGFVVSDSFEFLDKENDKRIQTISEASEDIDFIILAANSVDCYWKIIELELPHLVISDAFWDYYQCL